MNNNDPSAPLQQQQTLNIKLISNQPPTLNAANMPDSGPGPENQDSKTDKSQAKKEDKKTKTSNEEKDKARKQAALGDNIYPQIMPVNITNI